MSIKAKRWVLLVVRYLIAVVIPLIIFAIKFNVFAKVETVGAFGIICMALIGLFAIRGIVKGTTQNIPSRYAYIGKMLQTPFLLIAGIGCVIGVGKLGPQMLFVLEVVLIFNLINIPFNVWYNHILYELYGDAITEHIEGGVLDGITNYFKNKEPKN